MRKTERQRVAACVYLNHALSVACGLRQELSSRWDGRPFGHNRHGPKVGRGCCGGLGPHLTQCGLGRGLPLHWQDRQDRTDRQRSDSIGRSVLQTVAQKLASCFKRTYSEETDELVKVRFIRSINRTPAHARVPSTQRRQLSKVVVPC